MSATMNTSGQHEFHPDAESLNAFAEQSLAERERNEVLDHLAACGRCRQVVALARQAAEAEMAPAAAQRTAIDPGAWWRKWRLVWVPAAVAAAFGALAISVHLWQGAQNLKMAQVTNESGGQNQKMAAAVQEQIEAAPLASPPAATAKKEMKPAAIPHNPRSRQAEAKAAMPPPPQAPAPYGAINQLETATAEAAPPPAPAPAWKLGEGFTAGGTPTIYRKPAAAQKALKQQQTMRQALEASAVPGPLFTPKATPQANGSVAIDGTLERSSAQAVSSTGLHEIHVAPLAGFGAFRVRQSYNAIAEAARAAHLPSGLAAISTAIAGPRMLAIDGDGALFLSEDAGQTWQRITQQWTGRAVVVRRQNAGSGVAASAPETAVAGILSPANRQPEGSATGADGAASPAVVFEILNDKSQVWLSRDGRFWSAK